MKDREEHLNHFIVTQDFVRALLKQNVSLLEENAELKSQLSKLEQQVMEQLPKPDI